MPLAYPTPEDSPSSRDASRTRKHNDEKHTSGSDDADVQPAAKRQRVIVQCGDLCYLASHYKGHQPRLPVTPEHHAINGLAAIWNAADRPRDDCNIWELTDFTIYHDSDYFRHANELCPVHHLMAESGVNQLVFDGVISVDTEQRFVKGVPFDCLAVEGYGDESGKRGNVWYELKRPAREYARYYNTSLWVFQFTKYVVDFLECSEQPVTLRSFRRDFFAYVNRAYQHTVATKEWLSEHPSRDFGQAFCANLAFLVRECYSVSDQLLEQPIFGETDTQRLRAIPTEVLAYEKTVVTPFVFDSFRKMPFHSQMQVLQDVDPTTHQKQLSRRIQLGLTPLDCLPTCIPPLQNTARKVRKGDVVSVYADTKSQWRGSRGIVWYAFVQEVRKWKNGALKLDILWLYEPSDTTLGHGHYPYQNELFISDNCSCGEDAIDAETVQSIVPVQWFITDPEQSQDSFFVRQKFRTEPMLGAYDFTQLQPSDFNCVCRHTETELDKVMKEFGIGDTVLVYHQTETTLILEPAVIRGFTSRQITLQALLRCRRDLDDDHAPPNQLKLADGTYEVGLDSITRSCKVATFATIEDVRSPYDRGGAGDCWFVISLTKPTWNCKQALATENRLNGMGIFCGAGSLDRGLEEGDGLGFKWAIDIAQHALHSYRANAQEPEKLSLFLGSVDDYLAKAIQGSADCRIANIGDVDVLAAGSPCPGFSVLQPDKNSIQSLRNCSLVASVCSYVDFYMPTYLVLENVIGMASAPKNAKELNVFSQVLCCLVSMGYQVKQLLMDPGHYGSCQSRQRLFILATAPGHTPPDDPPQTHTCRELLKTNAIGYASNGLPFGQRKHDVCPHPFVTAQDAFGDLPDIADGHVQTCIQAPDHRLCRYEDLRTRAIIQMVPRWPRGQGFMQAYAAGKMSKQAIADYRWDNQNRGSKHSKSWSRLYPNRLVGCLTTMIKPHDSFTGRTLHWDQPRLMSVMEARRVQGIPDNEIIIGKPSHQWKQVGNGVDRKVAFALGCQIAIAHQKTVAGQEDSGRHVAAEDLQNVSPSRITPETRQEVVVQLSTETSSSASAIEKNMTVHSVEQDVAPTPFDDNFITELTTHRGVVPRALFENYTKAPSKGVFQKDGTEYIVID
ncbi:S-adenosyl-L-methionine-dependent methyltransferase [Aureobasidium subglaciale]|nr:S-adenosyl-L-methionine-dependent methyltransferase [Aureobasidium subglaciale]